MAKCYVYLLKDGDLPIYVGKGTGRRAYQSKLKHGGEIHYLEKDLSDDAAFKRERFWIAELTPPNNILAGGNGGRSKPKPKPRKTKFERDIERIGSRKYVAQFLMTRLAEHNCEQWGVSKVDLSRLREVAHG